MFKINNVYFHISNIYIYIILFRTQLIDFKLAPPVLAGKQSLQGLRWRSCLMHPILALPSSMLAWFEKTRFPKSDLLSRAQCMRSGKLDVGVLIFSQNIRNHILTLTSSGLPRLAPDCWQLSGFGSKSFTSCGETAFEHGSSLCRHHGFENHCCVTWEASLSNFGADGEVRSRFSGV